jgi:DNA-binding CsgD family transcriptional regulator
MGGNGSQLIGREGECGRIDALLDDAQAGRSCALLVTGEAGIGKSALLEYARARANGMARLRAQGVESEAELAFAALADFFHPALDCLAQIPGHQAAALSGALAIGPPTASDRFAVCAATLSLLGAASDERPLLGVVDDAHWLDASSAQAFLFAARRLGGEGVALLIALRDTETTVFQGGELDELHLGGLEREAAGELLARSNTTISDDVADRLFAETAGNPLALLELSRLLSERQLAGQDPLGSPLPAAVTVEQSFRQRVAALPESTQRALLVVAASESGRLHDIEPALETLDLRVEDLDGAERAGLIDCTDETAVFRHPLLRSAVYHSATASARRAVHRALAAAAIDEPTQAGRAWHLAAGAAEHDEEVGAVLERSARETRRRGGHAEAASALARAAELTQAPILRARRLLEAADGARIAGRSEWALRLLDDAMAATSDPLLSAEIQHLRGVVEMWRGEPLQAYAVLVAGAESAQAVNPSKAARMLADAGWACFMAGNIQDGLDVSRRGRAVADGTDDVTEILAGATYGLALLLGGDSEQAMPLFQRYQRLREGAPAEVRAYHLLRPAGQVLMWLERYDAARTLFDEMIALARAESALGALPYALAGLADVNFRTGNWVAAYAGASEAVRIADETDQRTLLAFALISLARVEAAQGREAECRAHVASALDNLPSGSIAAYAQSTFGLLELGLGQTPEAITVLRELAHNARLRGLEEPNAIQWAPDLVEAYMRAGRPDDAAEELALFAGQAQRTGRTWALAAASRCRGLLADDGDYDEAFAEAFEWHEHTRTPFEKARTELCYGERLRRDKRRADAREPLESALRTFEKLQAAPWIERAASELAATGVTARAREQSAAGQLTPQELQVALTVAEGATNREAGAALFLSPKTIETHLSRVYRKLNVRSRTELAHLLATSDVTALHG